MFEITPEVEEKYKNLIEAMQAKVFDNNKGVAPGILIQKADKNVSILKNEYSQILALEIQKFEKLYISLDENNFLMLWRKYILFCTRFVGKREPLGLFYCQQLHMKLVN